MTTLNKNYKKNCSPLEKIEEKEKLLLSKMLSPSNQETVNGLITSANNNTNVIPVLLNLGCTSAKMAVKSQLLLLPRNSPFYQVNHVTMPCLKTNDPPVSPSSPSPEMQQHDSPMV
jgi:hypothetical protein